MTYEATILADGPVAYWPLNALNASGHYQDATASGYVLSFLGLPHPPVTTSGPVAGEVAPLFCGSNGLHSPSTFSFAPYVAGTPQPFSVEFWCYGFSAAQMIFWWGQDSAAQSSEALGLWCESQGTLRIFGQNVHQQPSTISLDASGTAHWHHVVLTYTGSAYAYYVDAVAKTAWDYNSPNSPFIGTPPASALYLGYPPGGVVSLDDEVITPFAGALAHVAFYASALSAGQVSAHYGAASPPTATMRAILNQSSASALDLSVFGDGWAPSSTVSVTFDGTSAGTYATDSTGSWPPAGAPDLFPPIAPAGYHLVQATDGTTALGVQALLSPPEIQTGSASTTGHAVLAVGDTFEVRGDTFIPSETVTLTIDGASFSTTPADSSGSILADLVVPSLAPGVHTIGAADSQNTAGMDFYVIYATSATTSATYRAEVQADSPSCLLPLTEAGGGPYADISSGGAHGGTRLGGQTTTAAGLFPGETAPRLLPLVGTPTPIDYISLASPGTLPQQNAWTYEIWVSPRLDGTGHYLSSGYPWNIDHLASSTTWHTLLALQFGLDSSSTLWTYNHYPGSAQGTIWSWSPQQYSFGLFPQSAKGEIWYHVVATWDGQFAAYYINGAPVVWDGFTFYYQRYPPSVWRGAGFNQPLAETISGAYLGGNSTGTSSGGGNWLGRLAYFAAYDHALGADRVLCHWNAAVTGTPCGGAVARRRPNTLVVVQ